MIDRSLLHDMLRMYPAQPATAVWRAVEIGALLRLGIPHGRGLDLGCGDGKLTALILGRCGPRDLVGIDPDPLETQAAALSGIYSAVHACPGERIPEPDASFDFVISNSVLEHIPDLEPVLAEAARLLRLGGQFLFTVPGPAFHKLLRGSLLPWAQRTQYLADLDRRLAHWRYPSTGEWDGLCSRNGLRMQSCLGYLDRDETRAWETWSRFTGGLLYAVWGKRKPPIRIQRELGLRQLQNRSSMPGFVADGLTGFIMGQLPGKSAAWLDESKSGCLLVHGIRP